MMNEPPLTVLHVHAGTSDASRVDDLASVLIGTLAGRADVLQAAVLPAASRLARRAAAADVEVRPVARLGGTDGALARLYAVCAEDWDVIHAHDGRALRWALAARALAGGRSPVLATWQDVPAGRRPRAERRADLVVAPSPEGREALVRRGLDRRRVEVFPPALRASAGVGGPGADAMLRIYRVLARRPSP